MEYEVKSKYLNTKKGTICMVCSIMQQKEKEKDRN